MKCIIPERAFFVMKHISKPRKISPHLPSVYHITSHYKLNEINELWCGYSEKFLSIALGRDRLLKRMVEVAGVNC